MRDIGLESTIAFLRRPDTYRDAPSAIVAIETHMSWVFLTEAHAYKLKKPLRHDGLDFSTADLRRRNCEEEVRLNRRLAPDVYLGVSAITSEANGTLALDGPGHPIDWLVRMRRLPADRMLSAIVTEGRHVAEEAGIRGVARYLARFYLTAQTNPIRGPAHRSRLEAGVQHDLRELARPHYGLPRQRLEALAKAQLTLLERNPALFDRRADAKRIVEGHGDLRPEHICVREEPAIFDCLEFAQELRVLDPADELAFLFLECERLGHPCVGQWFLDEYRHVTGDEPPSLLLHFYRVYRALRRATLAAWHLDDPTVPDPERFAVIARRYLELVEPVAFDSSRVMS